MSFGRRTRTKSYSTIIGNTAFKTLPTAAVTLVVAPAALQMIDIVDCTLLLDASAGAYTNGDPAACGLALFVGNAQVTLQTTTTFVNGNAGRVIAHLLPGPATSTTVSDEYQATDLLGLPLTIFAYNGALGNFTGGNAANKLYVSLNYRIKNFG